MTKIIGFCYKKGVGKDTIAKFLSTYLACEKPELKVRQVSFAAKLKDVCFQLYGWSGLQRGVFYESHRHLKEVVLWPVGLTPREIWINVGNALRGVYAETWIKAALYSVKQADILIVTDVGFQNEAKIINQRGGLLFKLERGGLPQGTDGREIELDSWNNWAGIIDNNGTLADLNAIAESIGREFA